MDIYYSLTNGTELMDLAVEAGRAAHMLRNYTQGYVNLNHPEVATCDNLCGQIEGQIRALTAHLREKKEVKQILSLIGRTSVFLGKILEPGFLADEKVDASRLDTMKYLLKIVKECTMKIDTEINLAVLRSSMSDFACTGSEDKLKGLEVTYDRSEFVTKRFDPMGDLGGYGGQFTDAACKQEALFSLASHMSNKAHEIQDAVSSYLLTHKDQANQIINTAGQMENDSRAVLTLNTVHRNNVPQEAIAKHLNKIATNLEMLKDVTSKDTFTMKELRPQLEECFARNNAILDTTRTVLSARVG